MAGIAAVVTSMVGILAVTLAESDARAGFVKPFGNAPAVAWAVGDGADGSATGQAVAEMIEAREPDRFLYLGDVYETGTAEDFAEGYAPVYRRFDRIAAPTPGNHEWGNRDEGYYPYWAAVKGRRTPDWYATRAGRWQILSLNSETDSDRNSPQVEWLKRKLRSTRRFGNCRLAFWHRPRYSAGRAGDFPGVAPLWRTVRGRARIVVNGHDHDMQRHLRRDGITAFVSGAGGHELRNVDEDDPRVAFARDHTPGALRLVLRRKSANAAFFSAAGERLDSHRMTCHRPKRR